MNSEYSIGMFMPLRRLVVNAGFAGLYVVICYAGLGIEKEALIGCLMDAIAASIVIGLVLVPVKLIIRARNKIAYMRALRIRSKGLKRIRPKYRDWFKTNEVVPDTRPEVCAERREEAGEVFKIPEMNHTGQIIYLMEYHPVRGENGKLNKEYDEMSQLVLDLKDGKREALDWCFEALDALVNKGVCVCDVPSSRPENLWTGTFMVAQRLAKAGREDYTFALKREKRIDKLSAGGNRSINVHLESVVVCKPEMVKGKRILLFDDVTTTGNSLMACRKLLLEAGAREVEMLAIAKTERSGAHDYKNIAAFKKSMSAGM